MALFMLPLVAAMGELAIEQQAEPVGMSPIARLRISR
jgi:hypothetical protein